MRILPQRSDSLLQTTAAPASSWPKDCPSTSLQPASSAGVWSSGGKAAIGHLRHSTRCWKNCDGNRVCSTGKAAVKTSHSRRTGKHWRCQSEEQSYKEGRQSVAPAADLPFNRPAAFFSETGPSRMSFRCRKSSLANI